ncbi:tetratricopeptide repeat protein [Myxococcota bacterium]|nr:tetratricopeptide repeat protein [Myxococcota bacterium]
MSEWFTGVVAIVAGLSGAAIAASRLKDGTSRPAGSSEGLDDLREAQAFLMERVGELDADRAKLDPGEYRALRAELERELADLLRELDTRSTRAAGEAAGEGASPRAPAAPGWLDRRPVVRGALWGGGTVAFFGVLVWVLTMSVGPRGPMMTGGAPPDPVPPTGSAGGSGDGANRQGAAEDQGRVAALRARLEADPADLDAALALSHALLASQQFDEAARYNDRVLEKRPDDPEALVHLGLMRSVSGDLDGGVAQVDAVLQVDPKMPEALLFRGMLAMQGRDRSAAVAYWRRYLEVAPPGARTDRVRAAVSALGAGPGDVEPGTGGPAPP